MSKKIWDKSEFSLTTLKLLNRVILSSGTHKSVPTVDATALNGDLDSANHELCTKSFGGSAMFQLG